MSHILLKSAVVVVRAVDMWINCVDKYKIRFFPVDNL